MKMQRTKRGFTLAETLITVAILIVLLAVAFIAVPRYLRSMAQLERDNIAKEIFIAAQNHLTMAESQGYLGGDDYGTLGTATADKTGDANEQGIYYFVVNGGDGFSDPKSVLNQMLPFASVDETIRLGGSYIIRYQKSPALVLDVFYSAPNGRFPHSFAADEYATLVDSNRGAENKAARRNYNGSVIGWYGNAEAAKLPTKVLKAPEIEIINAERLQVLVTNPNTDSDSLTLILTGETSKNQVAIPILKADSRKPGITIEEKAGAAPSDPKSYLVTLDDITVPGQHFAELFSSSTNSTVKDLIPGENLSVQAVAFNNDALSNVEYSAAMKTNSLYADVVTVTSGTATTTTASVSNIRHLENLDAAISGLGSAVDGKSITLTNAVQTTDLDWKRFDASIMNPTFTEDQINSDTYAYTVQVFELASGGTTAGYYHPVDLTQAISYDGQRHTVFNIRVNVSDTAAAGMFGTAGQSAAATTIENLMLKDFSIRLSSTNGAAGALAGQLTNVTVKNVVAIHSDGQEANAILATGDAGGLVGTINSGAVEACAAALIVTSTGDANAGGLVGSASSTVFTASYSGGHTTDGAYSNTQYNVTSKPSEGDSTTGIAGGLIGECENVTARYCYSTCSVSGATAGGLIGRVNGEADSSTFTSCYCTGLVSGSGNNAFLGSGSPTLTLNGSEPTNLFYEIINEVDKDGGGKTYKGPGAANVAALDGSTASYNAFVGAFSAWTEAEPYDSVLETYYNNKFNLQSVERLGWSATTAGEYFVETHYGDWPAPELFIING